MSVAPAWLALALVAVALLAFLAFVALREAGQLRTELRQIGHTQEALRLDVQRGREAALVGLSQTTQSLQGQLGQAQRALAEVKALEQGRTRQLDYATDALRRLEAVVAGSSSRGAAGESLLARGLGQLPPDLLFHDVPFGGRVVEYALRLPDGRYLPVDSKWTSLKALEGLQTAEDAADRTPLVAALSRDLRGRIREMAKYLDPERTVSLAVLAVPDAVHAAAPEVHSEGWAEGVLVVPYSLALPFVLTVYRLALRFGAAADQDALRSRLHVVDQALRSIEDEVEGRLSRGLVQVQNARDALRGHASEARSASARLLRASEAAPEVPALAGRAAERD
ncbi:MAG TPA: DNA recombination protein RmuC [Vicinamibacteria bacterium]